MASAILCTYWLLYTIVCLFLGVIYLFDFRLPQALADVLLFGKSKDSKRKWTIIQLFEVPKSWFYHFYLVGTLLNGYVFYVCVCGFIIGQRPPAWLTSALYILTDSPRPITTGAASAVLLILFMFLQNVRRLYECLFISVYSKGTMNVVHYSMGLSLYTLFHLSVLCEAPDMLKVRIDDIRGEFLQWKHLIGATTFLLASWQQNIVHKTFASLRRNEDGEVSTLQHKIPHGGWFEYVSCPHYLMELCIYFSFTVVAGPMHLTMWAVFLFVLSNQIFSAGMAQKWYRNTYTAYPKHRKALIPFIW